jgi:hypothetical protein
MPLPLAEIQDRVFRASEGPWRYKGQEVHVGEGFDSYTVTVANEGDGEFIAHARTDVERLVNEVARLRMGLGAARDGLTALRANTTGLVAETIQDLVAHIETFC